MTYKIKSGDTLSSIAKNYNTTVDALVSANNIKDKNVIYTGSTLTIPETKTVSGGGSLPVNPVRVTTVTPPSAVPAVTASAATKKAAADYDNWKSRRPAGFKDKYSSVIDSLLSSLGSRKFSYTPEKDPVYNQYRNKYISDARSLMEDTMGNAAAKTGGFSNSYAQTAGNLAYNKTMQDFAEIIPELYEIAYNRYSDEGDDLEDRIKLLESISEDEWDRYSDTLKNYLTEGKMLEDLYSGLTKDDMSNYLKYLSIIK